MRSSLKHLLENLDRLAEHGNVSAEVVAADIRENGREAVERHLAKSINAVRACAAWLRLDPIVAALAAYDQEVSGVDWGHVKEETPREVEQRLRDWADDTARRRRSIVRDILTRHVHTDIERFHHTEGQS